MLGNNQVEGLRKHVRNFPCYTCLVRPLCITIYSNPGSEYIWTSIKDQCSMFTEWAEERERIANPSEERSKIMKEEISKILRMEKEEYAKSSENR